jgi:outer membrane lipoprotein-sorting protein
MNTPYRVPLRWAVVCLLTLGCAFAQAQDFKTTLAKMKEVYEGSRQFHIRMSIRAYDRQGAKAPFYQQVAEVFRDGENFYYQMTDQEMLMNQTHFLMVNKARKEMVFQPRSQKEASGALAKPWMNLDSLLSTYDTPTYSAEANGVQQYHFKEKKGPLESIDLFFSAESSLIKKIAYHYRNGQYATVAFTRFDLTPVFAAGTFDEKRFIGLSKGKYQGVGTFAGYQVHVPR